jgi:hypothetical protein
MSSNSTDENYREWNAEEWQEFARKCAADAHENHFGDRRGARYLEDTDVLCFFNNNPYASGTNRRDQEVAGFRDRMKAAGIKELAYATWPPAGRESAGYTFAMIVDASRDQQDRLDNWWMELMVEGMGKP